MNISIAIILLISSDNAQRPSRHFFGRNHQVRHRNRAPRRRGWDRRHQPRTNTPRPTAPSSNPSPQKFQRRLKVNHTPPRVHSGKTNHRPSNRSPSHRVARKRPNYWYKPKQGDKTTTTTTKLTSTTIVTTVTVTTPATTAKPKCPNGKVKPTFNEPNNVVTAPSDACVWACAKQNFDCKMCSAVDPENCAPEPNKDKYCCMVPNGANNKCQCIPKLRVEFNLDMGLASSEVQTAIRELMYIPKYKLHEDCDLQCGLHKMNWSCRRPTKQDGSYKNFKCCMEKGIINAADACRAMPQVHLINRFKREQICQRRCFAQVTYQSNEQLRCIGRFSKL